MSVVSRDGLIALKKLSQRPQDIAEIDALTEVLAMAEPDMSPRAITTRLRWVSELRRLGLLLKKAKILTPKNVSKTTMPKTPAHQKQAK